MNPFKNPEADALAVAMGNALPDKAAAMKLFNAFRDSHPDLKMWEAHAIGNRAVFLARQKAMDAVK